MAASTRRDLTEPFAHPLFGGEVMELKLAPGTKTGYKGVSKGVKKTYQARATIDGKLRHVWTCSDPQECAFMLARFEQYPCLLQSQRKERGEWTGRMTDAEAAEFDERARAAMPELAAAEQELEHLKAVIAALKRGREPTEEREVDCVRSVQRVPLSPVKNNLI